MASLINVNFYLNHGRKLAHTVICKCINTPVKRQYINAHFEMAVYHRKRVATIINCLSFISIDMKGFPLNFGRKIFTGFEMTELESYTSTFFHYLLHKMSKKEMFQISSSAISKPVKIFLPKLNKNPLTSILMGDQKFIGVVTLLLSWTTISKKGSNLRYMRFN